MFEAEIHGCHLIFETNNDVFSPSFIDRGTIAMLSAVTFNEEDKLLDLGCGYGAVGLFAARTLNPQNIVMCDISSNAVKLSKKNAELNHIEGITILESDAYNAVNDINFTIILSNPPYHTDFSTAKRFIEGAYKRLLEGGRIVMVTKRLDWYKNKLTSVFGGVKINEIDGYYVFTSIKKPGSVRKPIKDKKGISKKLKRKYTK